MSKWMDREAIWISLAPALLVAVGLILYLLWLELWTPALVAAGSALTGAAGAEKARGSVYSRNTVQTHQAEVRAVKEAASIQSRFGTPEPTPAPTISDLPNSWEEALEDLAHVRMLDADNGVADFDHGEADAE